MFGSIKNELIKQQMGEIDHLMKQNKELVDTMNKAMTTMLDLFDLAMEDHEKKAETTKGKKKDSGIYLEKPILTEPTLMKKKHALRGVPKIQGTKITGAEARLVRETYCTRLTKERYNTIIQYLFTGKRSFSELKALIGYSDNNVYAHLIYGEKIGEIQKPHGKMFYELSETKIKELNNVTKT